jgi:RNA polymerase sigma-70 factor (ECF subfamily)
LFQDHYSDPGRELDEKELAQEIQQAVSVLPADMKALIILFYYEEIPQKDIAGILKLPLGTVKSRLNRARLVLKRILSSQAGETVSSAQEVCLHE